MIKLETPKMMQNKTSFATTERNLSNDLASVKATNVKELTEQYAKLLKKLQNKLG